MATQKNRLNETVLLSTQNVFRKMEDIWITILCNALFLLIWTYYMNVKHHYSRKKPIMKKHMKYSWHIMWPLITICSNSWYSHNMVDTCMYVTFCKSNHKFSGCHLKGYFRLLRTYATKYFPHWNILNTLHTVCFMHGLSIYEIKRICHHAYFFRISYWSLQHLTNFLEI